MLAVVTAHSKERIPGQRELAALTIIISIASITNMRPFAKVSSLVVVAEQNPTFRSFVTCTSYRAVHNYGVKNR